MLGLSFGELVFTIVLVVVVWRAFKYWERIKDGQAARPKVQSEGPRRPGPPGRPATVELVACPHCGTFHPKDQPCGCGQG